MQPLVSVIIPLYNAELYIAETIKSVLNQTYKNLEIIIIDDGSTDSSFEVANAFQNNVTIVVKQQNKGASAARNHGLSLAKGDFIQYLDADDVINSQKIEFQIRLLERFSPLYLVGCRWSYFKKDINVTYKTMPFELNKTTCFNKTKWLMDRPYMIPHTWLVSKKLTEMAGLWDEKLTLNDDGEYFYRIIAASEGVVLSPNVLAYYRAGNPNSLSMQRSRKAMISWLESIKSYKKIMWDLSGDNANIAVDRSMFEVAYHCLNTYPDVAKLSISEMYQPNIQHNLYDNLVFNLSKIIGLSRAKKTRDFLTRVRNSYYVDLIVVNIKKALGKEYY